MTLPYTLANGVGNIPDADQLMGNFNYLLGSPAFTGSPTIAGTLAIGGVAATSGFNLTVANVSGHYAIQINNGAQTIRIGAGAPEIGSAGADFQIRTTDSQQLILMTNNTTAMTITTTQRVSFINGTAASPAINLEIQRRDFTGAQQTLYPYRWLGINPLLLILAELPTTLTTLRLFCSPAPVVVK